MFFDLFDPPSPELQPSNDINATALAIAWSIVKETGDIANVKDPEQAAAMVQRVHAVLIKG